MKYSFVIPCYNSEQTIRAVVIELLAELKKEKIEDYEIILVDDCSQDRVWEVITALCDMYDSIFGICLSKNFGQHAALLAGYARCTGDIVISLAHQGHTTFA